MKLIYRLLLAAALFAGTAISASAQGKCLPSRTDGVAPFASGESIVFSVSYNWHAVQTDVARADLSVDQTTLNGEKVWHTKMAMKTAPFFDVFFKIRETFESWFALKGVEPRRFHRDTREGDYTAINDYVYDRPAGKIHAVVNYRNQGEETLDIPYGNCTYDVTSLFYFVRQMDFGNLKSGQAFPVNIAIDREVLAMKLTYLGKENKYVKGIGTVAARKFGISLKKGEVFAGDQDAILWFSDDDNHIPVAFMAPLKVGAMNGRLKSYTGLAHPFTALISDKKVK